MEFMPNNLLNVGLSIKFLAICVEELLQGSFHG
jgi:hypothetical protein